MISINPIVLSKKSQQEPVNLTNCNWWLVLFIHEERGNGANSFAVLKYFCNFFFSTLCSSISPWPLSLPGKYWPNPFTLHFLWERVENRTWRNPLVRIKAGKTLTSSCCGQHRLDLEKFKLILLVCCVNGFPSSDIDLNHALFCSLHLSLSRVLCPFLNTPSKKCHECDWRAQLCSVVAPCGWDGLCLARGSSWPFLSEAALQLLLSTPGHLPLARESYLSISLQVLKDMDVQFFQLETEQGFALEIQQAILTPPFLSIKSINHQSKKICLGEPNWVLYKSFIFHLFLHPYTS